MRALAIAMAGGLALLLGMVARGQAVAPVSDTSASGRTFDWCAPVVVNPLRRWSGETCGQPWGPDEIAAGADVVLLEGGELAAGGDEVSLPGADPCQFQPTLASHARYLRELRARAAGRKPQPLALIQTRFDLVKSELASQPGFDAGFLVRASRPWEQVLAFFSEDRSPDCAAGGCRLAEPDPTSKGGDPQSMAPLVARVDAMGGPGSAHLLAYYLERSAPGKQVYRVTAALADLSNPAYRAWRVAEARRVLELGGYDAVMLNHKLHQYLPAAGGHWIGSPKAPDVTTLNRLQDTLWSTPPKGYEYLDYVQGWHDLAADFRQAGVPYGVEISIAPWVGDFYEDPRTPISENRLIREAARGARVVLLDWPRARRGAEFATVRSELEAAGARVVPMEGNCGKAPLPSPPAPAHGAAPPRAR